MSFASAAEHPDPQRSSTVVPIHSKPADKPGRVIARKRSKRAARKISALGEMTGGIAHDFRNILCVITSGLNVAERNPGDSAKVESALTVVREGVERGMKMTNRLLAFAKQQELETGPEDVNTLLAKLKSFLRYGAGPGIRVILELARELPKCRVDPPQFNAAILNLVVNARDAMPEGGLIRISTSAIRGMNLGRPCNYVRVRVSDHGSGMPAAVIKRIFDPYFTTKGDSGTGLGVPQVQALMRQVGGYVTVDSALGKGTSFDLFFPVHEDRPAASGDAWRQLDRWADEGGAIVTPRRAPGI
jgi:signal transduction histidine kinase